MLLSVLAVCPPWKAATTATRTGVMLRLEVVMAGLYARPDLVSNPILLLTQRHPRPTLPPMTPDRQPDEYVGPSKRPPGTCLSFDACSDPALPGGLCDAHRPPALS